MAFEQQCQYILLNFIFVKLPLYNIFVNKNIPVTICPAGFYLVNRTGLNSLCLPPISLIKSKFFKKYLTFLSI